MTRLMLNAVGGHLPDTVILDSEPAGSPRADEILVEVWAAPISGAAKLVAGG